MLIKEESIHLQDAILRQKHDLLHTVEEGVKYRQDATSLDLNLTCLLLHRPHIVEQATILSKVDEGVEKARLDLMRQVSRLNLEVAEHCQDLGHWDLCSHLENVE